MNCKKYSFFFLLIFAGFNWAFAQSQDTLKREVEVIKEYQPTISDAKMIIETPKIKDSAQVAPTFNYQIKSTPIDVEKSINNIGQVNYTKPQLSNLGLGYLKAGFGNGFANFGEFVLNTKTSENSDFGIFLSHYYTYAKYKLISDYDLKTPESKQKIELFGRNQFRNNQLKWDLAYDRFAYEYYGFHQTDTSYTNTYADFLETQDITAQTINNFNAKIQLANTNSRSQVDYHIDLQNNYLWNKTGQRSNYLALIGGLGFDRKDFLLALDSRLAYNYQDSIQNSYANNTWGSHKFFDLALSPSINFDGENWRIKAGLNFGTIADADTNSKFHWSPNVTFQFEPIQNILSLYAGVNGGFQTNHYSKAITLNPYQRIASDLLPTENVFEAFGGFKGTINNQFSYVLSVNYSIFENYLQYYSTFTEYDPKWLPVSRLSYFENQFSVDYIDLSILTFGGKLRYSSEAFKAQLGANLYSYEATITQFSHLPTYDINLNIEGEITDQLSAYLNVNIESQQYGLVKYGSMLSSILYSNVYVEIPTQINVNIGAKYEYASNLMFFLDAKNLFNQNYQNWLGYVDPGTICTIGARFNF